MGYSTDFNGEIKISPKLKANDKEFLDKFFQIRHMKRDMSKLKGISKNAIKEFGKDGCFYLKDYDNFNEMFDDKTIINVNNSGDMPSLWCDLEIVEENGESFIQWNGSEKTYGVNVENGWFTWLIDNFFKPCGYVLNGEMTWQGEEDDDIGTIKIENNNVSLNFGG